MKIFVTIWLIAIFVALFLAQGEVWVTQKRDRNRHK